MSVTNGYIRGVECKLEHIRGVKILETNDGFDIVEAAVNSSERIEKFANILKLLAQKIEKIENRMQDLIGSGGLGGSNAGDSEKVKELEERLAKFESLLQSDDLRGPSGAVGPRGPEGPKGRVDKLHDIKDVNANGLQDGCVLVRRGNEWRAELLTGDE